MTVSRLCCWELQNSGTILRTHLLEGHKTFSLAFQMEVFLHLRVISVSSSCYKSYANSETRSVPFLMEFTTHGVLLSDFWPTFVCEVQRGVTE